MSAVSRVAASASRNEKPWRRSARSISSKAPRRKSATLRTTCGGSSFLTTSKPSRSKMSLAGPVAGLASTDRSLRSTIRRSNRARQPGDARQHLGQAGRSTSAIRSHCAPIAFPTLDATQFLARQRLNSSIAKATCSFRYCRPTVHAKPYPPEVAYFSEVSPYQEKTNGHVECHASSQKPPPGLLT